jgi:hypothetical protein
MRLLARMVSLVLVASSLVVVRGSLPTSAACQDPYVTYKVWVIRGLHKGFPDLPTFEDGPGGSITATVSRTDTLSATFGVATSVEAGAIFAKAKVEVSASITRTATATIGHQYTHKIKAGKYGHLRYGSWSKRIGWKKILHTALCQTELLKRGRATIPTNAIGWKYWATDN